MFFGYSEKVKIKVLCFVEMIDFFVEISLCYDGGERGKYCFVMFLFFSILKYVILDIFIMYDFKINLKWICNVLVVFIF